MSDVNPVSSAEDPRRWLILGVIGIAQLMVVLDVTVMNIALPSAQRALGFTTVDRQWVVTAYTLSFGSLLLLGGRLGDLFGRKVTFLTGLIGFASVSAIGGASVNFAMLVTARACQGAFAAILVPSALSLLTTTFSDPKDRGKAFGVYGAIAAAGSAVGLLLGGALTDEHGLPGRRQPCGVNAPGPGTPLNGVAFYRKAMERAVMCLDERRLMAQCITCGSELHPDRAKKYDYCMAPACQEKNLKDLTMVAIGVNKAAEQYLLLDERTRDELASGKFRDQRRGSFGTSLPSSRPAAGADLASVTASGKDRDQPAHRPPSPSRPESRPAPRRPWSKSQEKLTLLYNEQGLRPKEIADKLSLTPYIVAQIILTSRNRGKL